MKCQELVSPGRTEGYLDLVFDTGSPNIQQRPLGPAVESHSTSYSVSVA